MFGVTRKMGRLAVLWVMVDKAEKIHVSACLLAA